MADAGEVHIATSDRHFTAILRDVARAIGFHFRLDGEDLVVLPPVVPTRDQLAAMAMQGILAQETQDWHSDTPERLAWSAYAYADAMLAEREKGTGRG